MMNRKMHLSSPLYLYQFGSMYKLNQIIVFVANKLCVLPFVECIIVVGITVMTILGSITVVVAITKEAKMNSDKS